MLNLIILMIVLMDSSVIPFFTRSSLLEATTKIRIPEEWCSVGFSIALMAGVVVQLSPEIPGILEGSAAILHLLRLLGWQDNRVFTRIVFKVIGLNRGTCWL
jgi:uncharacterized protein involved in response to NO